MRRTSWIMMAAGLGMLCLVAGCGNPGGGGDMSTSAEIQQACLARATAYCAKLQSCAAFAMKRDYKDMADCVDRSNLTCGPRAGLVGTGVTPASLTACAASYAGLSCLDFQSGVNFLPVTCRPAGTLATTAKCGDNRQCTSTYCKVGVSGCGACTAKLAAGMACVSGEDCAFGLQCDTGARMCAKPAEQGAACPAGTPCKLGLVCDSVKKTCGTGMAVGAACTPLGTDCDGTQGLTCDGTSKKCVAEVLAQPGAACNLVTGSRVICAAGSHCYGTTGSRTCVPAAADGAACDFGVTSNGPGCQTGAFCATSMGTKGMCKVSDPTICK